MRTGGVVMPDERRQHPAQMAPIPDQYPVQAFAGVAVMLPLTFRRVSRSALRCWRLRLTGAGHGTQLSFLVAAPSPPETAGSESLQHDGRSLRRR